MPFFIKDLLKTIMIWTKLRNIFLQNGSEENRIRYTKQINFCVSLLRKIKKRYYEILNGKFVVDNKLFWKTVKSDNVAGKDKNHLIENNELVKTDLETAEVLNNLFSNIVQNLDISRFSNEEPLVSNTNDATLKVILKYRNHPSILAIRSKCKDKDNFNFIEFDQQQIEKDILKLDVNKASQSSDIPIKVLKEISDIFINFLWNSFNNSIKLSTFPEIIKHETPLYKKGKKDVKGKYRPVSILPNLSKIFEKCMFEQMSQLFENIFSKYQCGFWKGFSTQQCLLAMLEKWKRSVDNSKMFGILLTDLSKDFDCLDHELLIAKLNA